tara:strand:+ start:4788 stop:5600 length:813 start_codon:yes stop_codon:yes gene_type:complete
MGDAQQSTDLLTGGIAEAQSSGDAGNQGNAGSEGNGNQGASVTDQTEVPGWHESVKQELKGHKSLVKFKSMNDALDAYVDLEGKIGNAIVRPGDGDSPEEWSRYWKAIGRPDTQEGYSFEGVELPKGVTVPEATEKAFREKAHSLGLTQAQARELYAHRAQAVGRDLSTLKTLLNGEREKTEKALRQDWGVNYDQKMELARRAIVSVAKAAGDEDGSFIKLIASSGFGNHPMTTKVFSIVGDMITEGKSPIGDGTPPAPAPEKFPGLDKI